MRKVAVFGNTGGGKSSLARKLAALTRLPLYPLDLIQYRAGGGEVPRDEYLRAHAELLGRREWIIDGYGCRKSAWERFASADTPGLRRSPALHALSVGHEAPLQRPRRNP